MKGSVNKGFMTYLLLFLGMIVGVVLVCLTIMMFSPGTEILGYVYYNASTKTEVQTYNGLDTVTGNGNETVLKNSVGEVVAPLENPANIDFGSLTKIIVKTNSSSVNFVHGPEDRIDVVTKQSGFNKKSDIEDFVITKQYNSETKTLIITAYNPSLLLTLNNNNEINVIIQNQTANLVAEVETTTAPVTFANKAFSSLITKDLTIKEFKATTTNGDVTIGLVGKITNSLEVSVTKANITLKGNLGASESAKLSAITFNVGNGNVEALNLFTNLLTLTGETTFVSATNVYGNVECDIVRGNIEIENVYGNFTGSENVVNTKMVLGSIGGGFTLPSSQGASINIDDVSGIVYIRSESGNVEIKHAANSVNIETESGSIKILIEGDFNTLLKTTSGSVTALYKDVLKANSIETGSGTVNVFYKETSLFIFTANTTKTINLIAEHLTFENATITGYPAQADEVFETENTLTINSQANINVDRAQEIAWSLNG